MPVIDPDTIVVVSGLPRSGTSMMMSMLDAAGIPPVIDGVRKADDDNPKGYYEFERVKKIKEDTGWLDEAKGKSVKMISQLLLGLPDTHKYKVLFMRRAIDEVLASQKQMMVRRGTWKEGGPTDAEMRKLLLAHVEQVLSTVATRKNFELTVVDYNELLRDSAAGIRLINRFLGGQLNTDAMVKVVDQTLYRQRK
jgi:hypothetical protein